MILRVALLGRNTRNILTLNITTSSRVARRLRSDLSVLWNRKKHAVDFVLYRHQTIVESTLNYGDALRDLIFFAGFAVNGDIYALLRVRQTRSRKVSNRLAFFASWSDAWFGLLTRHVRTLRTPWERWLGARIHRGAYTVRLQLVFSFSPGFCDEHLIWDNGRISYDLVRQVRCFYYLKIIHELEIWDFADLGTATVFGKLPGVIPACSFYGFLN